MARAFFVLVTILIMSFLYSCISSAAIENAGEFILPSPPKPINAKFNNDCWAFADFSKELGNVTIIGWIKSIEEYDTKTIGERIYHSYYIVYDLIKVEKGSWNDSQIKFATYDAWPTPESGIKEKRAAFPFGFGQKTAYAFDIDTTKSLATIVKIESRSCFPPYERIIKPNTDWEVVYNFFENELGFRASGSLSSEWKGNYILFTTFAYSLGLNESELRANSGKLSSFCTWLLLLNKNTMEVKLFTRPQVFDEEAGIQYPDFSSALSTFKTFWRAAELGDEQTLVECLDLPALGKDKFQKLKAIVMLHCGLSKQMATSDLKPAINGNNITVELDDKTLNYTAALGPDNRWALQAPEK